MKGSNNIKSAKKKSNINNQPHYQNSLNVLDKLLTPIQNKSGLKKKNLLKRPKFSKNKLERRKRIIQRINYLKEKENNQEEKENAYLSFITLNDFKNGDESNINNSILSFFNKYFI